MFKYVTIENFLTKNECDLLLEYSLKNFTLKDGKVNINGKWDFDNHRKSKVFFYDYNNYYPFLKNKIENVINELINIKGYEINFDNRGYQFTQYNKGDYYGWHTDSINDNIEDRFCSIVIQLNGEYVGGNLEMKLDNIIITPSNVGNLHIFLSNIEHRVTEVTDGVRYSMVNWFHLKPKNRYIKTLV